MNSIFGRICNVYLDLPVKIKLALVVLAYSGWLVVVGLLGLHSSQLMATGMAGTAESASRIIAIENMRQNLLTLRLDLVYGLVHRDRTVFDSVLEDAGQRIAAVQRTLETVRGKSMPEQERRMVDDFGRAFESYRASALRLVAMEREAFSGDRTAAASFAVNQVAPLYAPAGAAASQLVEFLEKQNAAVHQQGVADYRKMLTLMILVGCTAIVLGIFFGAVISVSITRPLQKTIAAVGAMAKGDLTVQVPGRSRDDFGVLAAGINDMAAQTRLVIGELTAKATAMEQAVNTVFGNSLQMATAAEEIAAQAAAVAVAAEEMAATASEISTSCQYASEGAGKAEDAASAGAAKVISTVDTMKELALQTQQTAETVQQLGGRSQQIGEIVETIENIADQTNLLALNAAIEAARAGDQGRGFAVVADEVRALAERTAKATKEIAAMVRGIQGETEEAVSLMKVELTKVDAGTAHAAESGDALTLILNHINNLTVQMTEVATAAGQQTATTNDIAHNIHQISAVVAQAAEQAHESASAAQEVTRMTGDLTTLVKKFKVDSDGHASATIVAAG